MMKKWVDEEEEKEERWDLKGDVGFEDTGGFDGRCSWWWEAKGGKKEIYLGGEMRRMRISLIVLEMAERGRCMNHGRFAFAWWTPRYWDGYVTHIQS